MRGQRQHLGRGGRGLPLAERGALMIDFMSVVRWVSSVDLKRSKILENSDASFYLSV